MQGLPQDSMEILHWFYQDPAWVPWGFYRDSGGILSGRRMESMGILHGFYKDSVEIL